MRLSKIRPTLLAAALFVGCSREQPAVDTHEAQVARGVEVQIPRAPLPPELDLNNQSGVSAAVPPANASSDEEDPTRGYSEPEKIVTWAQIAKQKLESNLKDPKSAQYENVHAFKYNLKGMQIYVFCGMVNARNGYGGYNGSEPFVATPFAGSPASGDADYAKSKAEFCEPSRDAGAVATW